MQHELAEKQAELRELERVAKTLPLQRVRAVGGRVAGKKNACVVHLVRHGQAAHNVFAAEWRARHGVDTNPYSHPDCPVDPDLTEVGERDAARARGAVAQAIGDRRVVCVVSPLRRTLQTATRVRPPDDGFRHVVVVDAVREHFGLHVCDSLRKDFDRSAEFPFDWTRAQAAAADPARTDVRETFEELVQRGHDAVRVLREMGELEYVVVTHSSFLLMLFNAVLLCDDPRLAEPFVTGEVRTVTLHWDDK